MPREHLNIRVAGRVQGVSFRLAVRAQAASLGVTGFVRNEPDGTVYVEAEGSQRALQQLVAWCQSGTTAARVTGVSVARGSLQHYADFSIAG